MDIMMRSGTAVTEWPGDVHHPAEVILVKNSSFRAFHYDLEDGSDSILCLSGGKKLWLLAPASNVGRTLEGQCGGNDSQSSSLQLRSV